MSSESTDLDLHVRQAVESDYKYIGELEDSADKLFEQACIVGLPPAAGVDELKQAKALLVIGDPPVGFARIEVVGEYAHLEQLSVASGQQGKGIGTQLLEAVDDWARKNDYKAVTLSTFRDIAWNAPFYAKRGFTVMEELAPELQALREQEHTLGLDDIGPRVVMKKVL